MAPTLGQLHAMTDDELRTAYDSAAPNTVTGTAFHLDELRRRALDRAGEAALAEAQASRELARASLNEARASRQLALANMLVAIVAVIAAIVAIFVPLLA